MTIICKRVSLSLLLSFGLAGCAGFSADGGFDSVAANARQRAAKDLIWARGDDEQRQIDARVARLLEAPLSADDAVQLALLNNRALQAGFAQLRISEADLVQAGRLPNPVLSLFRAARPPGPGREYKIEQALTFNILSLLTMPQAVAIERSNFEQVQRSVSLQVLSLAAQTRKAYVTALAAAQSLVYARQVASSADASAELAARMVKAGNWNTLQQARQQAFQADAALGVARAEQAAVRAREQLTRLLGLWGAQTQFKLPERLPDLPAELPQRGELEQQAMEQRLDLQASRLQLDALAGSLGLTRATRFIDALQIGPARVLEGPADSGYKRGYEASFVLPLFDWGQARVARAEAIYMQAVQRAAQSAIDARSQVREAYQGYRTSYEIARRFRDDIVPMRKRIGEENLLRYNGMLLSVFELLADSRAQIASVGSAIEAQRDFWLAQTDLDMALIGNPQFGADTATPAGGDTRSPAGASSAGASFGGAGQAAGH